MKFLRLVVVPFVLLISAACFQGQRTFKVNADGSGTIVDTTRLGDEAQGMLKGLASMDTTSAADKKAKQAAEYTKKAAAMGEGVTFVSVVTAKDGSDIATYAFKDITKVKTSGLPSPDANSTSKDAPSSFLLTKNAAGNTVLTIIAPKDKGVDTAGSVPAKKSPEEIQQEVTMVKKMMGGLRVKSVVEVNGAVVKSSSPNTVGNVVTLLEIDFDAIDAAGLTKMSSFPRGAAPTPAMMKGVKGIKVSEPEVTIEFKR